MPSGASRAAAAEAECSATGSCEPGEEKSVKSTGNSPGGGERVLNSADLQCTVYMAPSTLGVDTSMGIYTAIPLEDGVVINYPEIIVPLLFREFGEHVAGYDDGVLWDRYVWEGEVMEMETYIETNLHASRAVFVPGVGCTVNSVLDMSNIQSTHGSNYSTCGLHRSKDPGSGAFTPYYNGKTIAAATLPAGAELFASYGDYWIPDIPGAQIALDYLLEEADEFMTKQFYPFVAEHETELTADMKQALWDFVVKDFPVVSKAFSNLPKNVPWSDIEAVLKQQQQEKLQVATNTSDDEVEVVSPVREFIRRQSVRNVDWLRQNGYCQDHLVPGISTIPQAGRGAFASRALPAGTIVGYAPLVHVGLYGRNIFTVDVGKKGDGEPPQRKQYDLIINYSFGHWNSTVMLTPYGGGVNYINHGGKEKANVKLRWPDRELIAHKPEFLQRTPYDLSNTVDKIGLSFEYVAIRDIAPGEEVLLDYGVEWEQAWAKHVAQWQPVPNASVYMHSTEWNESTFRTMAELAQDPYPPNLHTMCQESYSLNPDGVTYSWVDVLRPTHHRVYCSVIERTRVSTTVNGTSMDQTLYTVVLEFEDESTIAVKGVPSEGIGLYDKAFSADWHLPNVFRHEIAIPDDIMPSVWMNGPAPLPDHAK
jgi:hypothetical protein